MEKPTLTASRLRDLLCYDQETGVFTIRKGRGGRRAGSQAGCITKAGYVVIRVDGVLHYAHRLVVLYVTGSWPAAMVDHKDGFTADNKFGALRIVSHEWNMQNQRRPHRRSTTGILGVSWIKADQKYRASISVNGKNRYLGQFVEAKDAEQAYLTAKRRLHPGCTI